MPLRYCIVPLWCCIVPFEALNLALEALHVLKVLPPVLESATVSICGTTLSFFRHTNVPRYDLAIMILLTACSCCIASECYLQDVAL